MHRLIEAAAEINVVDNYRWAPIHSACLRGNLDLLNMLINAQAGINLQTNDGPSPIHLACEKGQLGILNRLIEVRADINIGEMRGSNARRMQKWVFGNIE